MSSHFDHSSGTDSQGRVRNLHFTQAIPGPLGYHAGAEIRTETPLRRRDSLTGATYLSAFRPKRGTTYPTMPDERSEVHFSADPSTAGPRVVYFQNESSNAKHFREAVAEEKQHMKIMRADNVHKLFSQIWRLWPSHTFEDRDVCRALALLWEADAARNGLEYPVFREYRQDMTEKLVRLRRMKDDMFMQDSKNAEEALYVYGVPGGYCDLEDGDLFGDEMQIHLPCDDNNDGASVDGDDDESLFGPGSPMQTDDDSL